MGLCEASLPVCEGWAGPAPRSRACGVPCAGSGALRRTATQAWFRQVCRASNFALAEGDGDATEDFYEETQHLSDRAFGLAMGQEKLSNNGNDSGMLRRGAHLRRPRRLDINEETARQAMARQGTARQATAQRLQRARRLGPTRRRAPVRFREHEQREYVRRPGRGGVTIFWLPRGPRAGVDPPLVDVLSVQRPVRKREYGAARPAGPEALHSLCGSLERTGSPVWRARARASPG